jgi:hypothetical protein
MKTLQTQKAKIQQAKEKLRSKERLIKLREQKLEDKRLYAVGRLARKAGLLSMEDNTLLGALLSIADQMENEQSVEAWNKRSEKAESTSKQESEAIIVSFKEEPSTKAKSIIKKLGLKWNKFRSEWYGYGDPSKVREELSEYGAEVESV